MDLDQLLRIAKTTKEDVVVDASAEYYGDQLWDDVPEGYDSQRGREIRYLVTLAVEKYEFALKNFPGPHRNMARWAMVLIASRAIRTTRIAPDDSRLEVAYAAIQNALWPTATGVLTAE